MSEREDKVHIAPGAHEVDGRIVSILDQGRAEALEALRTSENFSISIMVDDELLHLAVVDDEEPRGFLMAALVKCWLDLRPFMDDETISDILVLALAEEDR